MKGGHDQTKSRCGFYSKLEYCEGVVEEVGGGSCRVRGESFPPQYMKLAGHVSLLSFYTYRLCDNAVVFWMHMFLDIVYSEGSYVTVYSLRNTHLFPLIEITLTMNWQDGWTALLSAARNGHSNVVETLLQHGASVDMKMTVSAWLTEPSFISITSVWYITSTDWYNYVECV